MMATGYRVWIVDPNATEADEWGVTITKHRVQFPPGVEPSDELLQDSRDARHIAEHLRRELGFKGELREKIGAPIRIAR
ncbi:MAG TPA: hypothetical protein VMV69_28850 [Pirellulales bacterium]|nr:hypothetical protein [Pirellulales bacterium]